MTFHNRLSALALVVLGGGWAVSSPQVPHGNPQLLVAPAELENLLSNPDLCLIDARSPEQYSQGHIAGAVNLPALLTDDLEANRQGLPIPLERARQLFRQAGINGSSQVVVYDDQGNRFAARVFYTLEAFGHSRVQVLNGGISKWTTEGRPLTTTPPAMRPGDFEPLLDRSRIVTSSWVRDHLKDPGVSLVDARSVEEFQGIRVEGPRGGHIPGAVHIEWKQVIEPVPAQTFLNSAQLEELFRSSGVIPGKRAITYCQIGMRAADLYLALRLLGYDVRMYDGSWEDWSSDPALPVER